MTARITAIELNSYLDANGWRRHPETWRGASIWADELGRQLLVPTRDDFTDAELRISEAVELLTEVERRPKDDVLREISAPLLDVQQFRTFPRNSASGQIPLDDGVEMLRGVHDLVDAAGRAALLGPRFEFSDRTSPELDRLLRRVRLGAARAGSYVLDVAIPVDDGPGRALGEKLHDAVIAVQAAATSVSDSPELDQLVTAGASTQLCSALARLSGTDGELPFEVEFRWGRGRPTDIPQRVVGFEAQHATAIRSIAERIRRRAERPADSAETAGSEPADAIVGVIVDLHHDEERPDRWRVLVRGEFTNAGKSAQRREVWVRFLEPEPYRLAMRAHENHSRVRARGNLVRSGSRPELITDSTEFETLD